MAQAMPLQNDWNEPFHVFGPGEGKLRERILKQIGDFRIDSDVWKKYTERTEHFLKKLMEKIKEEAQLYKEEFEIYGDYVKGASARQGLKINEPDEFDVLIPFKMKGLKLQTAKLKDVDGKIIPGMSRQRVQNKKKELNSTHPRLKHAEIFEELDGVFINTENLQGRVWTKLIDKAVAEMKKQMPNLEIKRRSHPPAINIEVKDTHTEKITNYDLVPGLYTDTETITIPASITGKKEKSVNFPSYALLKCDYKKNPKIKDADRCLIWRDDTSSYERYMADLCLSSPPRQYIMTANRILKHVIQSLAAKQNHLGNLINSYHLKTIAYHIIARFTMNPKIKVEITGVSDALGHQLLYLRNCVNDGCLPDFFHANKDLLIIFPESRINQNHRQQNLFWKENPAVVTNAKYGFKELVDKLEGCYTSPEPLK